MSKSSTFWDYIAAFVRGLYPQNSRICVNVLDAAVLAGVHRACLWTPARRKRASMLYFANVFIYLFILWPPYSPAQVNGGSRKFYMYLECH